MKHQFKLTLPLLLILMLLTTVTSAQDPKAAAERDFERFDSNQSGWLSGKELIACQCKSYDTGGDNEVTREEFVAGRGLKLPPGELTNKDAATAQNAKIFKVGDRVEADPLLLDNWRKGRIIKLHFKDNGEINVYEIKFDAGEDMMVRAEWNAIRLLAGGEIDERIAATSSPALSVTARQVYDDYHNNQVAAKRKYVGKVIKVTGVVWLINYSEMVRSSLDLTAHDFGSAVTCYVIDKEQLVSLNKGETISIVGTVSGAYSGAESVALEPCKIVAGNAAEKATVKVTPANPPERGGGQIIASWYYIALVNADGSETQLQHRQSFLQLKGDGTFENRFGAFGGIGTYKVNGNSLTLYPENKTAVTYNLTFGDDGKKTFGLSGRTLTLVNKAGLGYKLEK